MDLKVKLVNTVEKTGDKLNRLTIVLIANSVMYFIGFINIIMIKIIIESV